MANSLFPPAEARPAGYYLPMVGALSFARARITTQKKKCCARQKRNFIVWGKVDGYRFDFSSVQNHAVGAVEL